MDATKDAPREVSLSPNQAKQWPPGYDDNYEYKNGITCCMCCSIPTAAKYICCCCGGCSIFGTLVSMIFWITFLAPPTVGSYSILRTEVITNTQAGSATLQSMYCLRVWQENLVLFLFAGDENLLSEKFWEQNDEAIFDYKGVPVAYVIQSLMVLAALIMFCQSLIKLGCSNSREIEHREKALKAPVIIICLLWVKTLWDIIVFEAVVRPDKWVSVVFLGINPDVMGEVDDFTMNFYLSTFVGLIINTLFFVYVYMKLKAYHHYAFANNFP